jgi:hypothetical protein
MIGAARIGRHAGSARVTIDHVMHDRRKRAIRGRRRLVM